MFGNVHTDLIWLEARLSKPPAIKCLLQFEVCGDQCSVLELLTVTDTRYPTTAGKALPVELIANVIWRAKCHRN